MVGDFEPTRAVWLGYDAGHAALTAQLAAALQPHVELRMLVAEAPQIDAARALLQGAGVDTARVRFEVERQDASREELDRSIARLAGARIYSSSLYLKGGGIKVNGAGVALVSKPLAQQRNPGVPRMQLQAAFEALPGIRKLIWLADGLASDPHLRATITGN